MSTSEPNATPADPATSDDGPIDRAPIDRAPIDTTPLDPAPMDHSPINAPPVDRVPIDPEPIQPLAPAERWPTIDVLRGIAILGILPVNIYSFGLPEVAITDLAMFDAGALSDRVARWATHLLAEMRFISIFTMLFGLGVWISADRSAGAGPAGRHYRRMIALLGFGLVHAYVFWYGDVLVLYAICGMLIYPMRRLSPGALFGFGIAGIAVTTIIAVAFVGLYFAMPVDERAELNDGFIYTQDFIDAEIASYRSTWSDQNLFRRNTASYVQTIGLFWFGPQTLGLMLIGIALGRWGLFWGSWSIAGGMALATVLIVSGVALTLVGRWVSVYYADQPMPQLLLGGVPNMLGAPLSAVGYALVVVSIVRTARPNELLRSFALLGRTALSNYLLQTLLCTTLFYGHGFGRFAMFSPAELVGVVIGVWIIQTALTRLWCDRYDTGPAEWLWRRVSYGRSPRWRGLNG